MGKRTHKDQVFDKEGNVLEETERTESDETYVQRVISTKRAPAQADLFKKALEDWDNSDGTANLFSSFSDRERQILWEFCAHMRANAVDEANDRNERIPVIADEFAARDL